MFEAEAKERARKLEESQTLGVYDNDEDYERDRGWNGGQVVGYEDGFKDGAEFGYNKANEWHYVKDGDLPKTKGNYLVAWERTHHIEEFGEWGFDVDLFNIEEEYFEGTGDYAIAWKEIVSPIISPKEASE